jgi:hypothetical protein
MFSTSPTQSLFKITHAMKWFSQSSIERKRTTKGDVINDLFSAATHHARRWLENTLRKYCTEKEVNIFIFGSILREMLRTSTMLAKQNNLQNFVDQQEYDEKCFISPEHDMDIFLENNKELEALLEALNKHSSRMYWQSGYKRDIYPGLKLQNYRLYFGGVVFPKAYLSVDFVCPSGGQPISDFTCNVLQLNLRTEEISYMYPPAQVLVSRLRPKGFLNLDAVTETVRYICCTDLEKKTQLIVLSPEKWAALFENDKQAGLSYKQYLRHLFSDRVKKIIHQNWEIVNLHTTIVKKQLEYHYRFPCGCEKQVTSFDGDQLEVVDNRVVYTCCDTAHLVTNSL